MFHVASTSNYHQNLDFFSDNNHCLGLLLRGTQLRFALSQFLVQMRVLNLFNTLDVIGF